MIHSIAASMKDNFSFVFVKKLKFDKDKGIVIFLAIE
jgi:hypothetical protein